MAEDEYYGCLDSNYIKNSLCSDCVYRLSREIKPLESTLEMWEQALNVNLTNDTILETHSCMRLDVDLDHTVLKCTGYVSIKAQTFSDNITKFTK